MVASQNQYHLIHNDTDYYYVNPESPRHFNAAIELCNNYIFIDKNTPPIDKQDFLEFTECPREINLIYLLYSLEHPCLYHPSFPENKNNRLRKLTDVITEEYHCLSLVGTQKPRRNKKSNQLVKLYSDTVCRSFSSDANLSAIFTDQCFNHLSHQLGGGVSEYEVCVSTSDIPLQLAFKSLGYFAFDVDEDAQEYYFSKIFEVTPSKPRKKRHRNK